MAFFLIISLIVITAAWHFNYWLKLLLPNHPVLLRRLLVIARILHYALLISLIGRFTIYPYIPKAILAIIYCWAALIVSWLPLGLIPMVIMAATRRKWLPFFERHGHFVVYTAIFTTIAIISLGHLNARITKTIELSYDLPLPSGQKPSQMKVAVLSDIHAGKFINASWVASLVNKTNAQNPDLILLPGDIIDDKQIADDVLAELAKFRAPLGVFGVLGNHEYYQGKRWALEKLEAANIKTLVDESLAIDNRLWLIGRDDQTIARFNGERKPLKDLLTGNPGLPTLVLDHIPFKLEEAANENINLQLSGHTHSGQIFPWNFVTDAIYEQDHGRLRKQNTEYYISSGAGVWGPPIRTSSFGEIVVITLNFK